MRRRDLAKGWSRRVIMVGLALLVGAAGLCLFDQDHDDLGDHSALIDLCLVALTTPAVPSVATALVPSGIATCAMSLAFTSVALVVPSPPPRRPRRA
jgi:hypothetical protein